VLERTLNEIKKADPQSLYDTIMEYCAIIGRELPKKVETRIMLALKLAEDGLPDGDQLSIAELQELLDFTNRSLALKGRQKRLLMFKNFIEETVGVVEMGDLALRGKELLSHFSPDLILVSSFSPDTLDRRCNSFVEEYRIDYVNYHNSWSSKRNEIGDRYEMLKSKVNALKKLNTIEELEPKLGVETIGRIVELPEEIPYCRVITIMDLGFSATCPYCGLKYRFGLDWKYFEGLEKKIDQAFRKKVRGISAIVADIAVEKYSDDPLRAFIDAVRVSDLRELNVVLNDNLLETIRNVLKEAKK
jgi:hypothetical protein